MQALMSAFYVSFIPIGICTILSIAIWEKETKKIIILNLAVATLYTLVLCISSGYISIPLVSRIVVGLTLHILTFCIVNNKFLKNTIPGIVAIFVTIILNSIGAI